MIYDEGFEVEVAGTKFFAFSKYTSKEDSDYSHCGETMPGWFHPAKAMDTAKWGCYFGVKDTSVPAQRYRKFGDRPYSKSDVYVHEEELIAAVNSKQAHWKAKRYTEFEGRPMSEMQRMSGTVLRPYKLQPMDLEQQQSWADDHLVEIVDLPKQWDWRNVGGKSFIGPVSNQGACGSCYSVAVSEMISARMRIVANDPTLPRTSPDRVLKCAMYAQGCAGGFPYLASKYLQDFGSVDEQAQPYTDEDGSCPAGVKVSSRNHGYKYVGGYYGACGERAMMRELFDHGPIVVGFEVGMGFNTYHQGIFHATEGLPEKNHWERVNHAVVIIGYGTENGVDFWTVKNSWGPDWGENGFFRIRRGDDNLNIEHMAVAAYPTIGSSLPPNLKANEVFMSTSKSMGHHFLALETNEQMKAVPVADPQSKKAHDHAKIEDPAFTRQQAAPVMEEVQVSDDDIVPDDTDTNSVVEEEDTFEWPDA